MNRVGKLKTAGVLLVVLFSFGTFYTSYSASVTVSELKQQIANVTKEPQVIVYKGENGKDARTPVKNVDYFDGANAISFANTVTQQVIKEVPLLGQDGKTPPCYFEVNQCKGEKGNSADDIVYDWNERGDLTSKKSSDDFPQVFIPCEKFVTGCVE
jgi:hypothetical protein